MQYYNSIAPGYNELHSEEQLGKASIIKENISLKGLLLDLGAGTGKATKSFSKQAECIALDPSIEMLFQASGMRVVARAEQLPFKSGCFDSIVSITALHHADLGKTKQEIERVSKKNAAIAISFFKRASNLAKAKALFSGFREIDAEKDLVFVKG